MSQPRHDVLLEICLDTAGGLAAAVSGGADRIELCSALSVGGLTPSPGLMSLAAELPIPSRAMVRPRAGDFVYGAQDLEIMRRDIDAVHAAGLSGVVIGAATAAGRLDMAALRDLIGRARGLCVTLHRIVDLVADDTEVVELAGELGVDTVLTSGGAKSALKGAERIAAMREMAGDRLEIMAGAGVRAETVHPLLSATGVRAVHGSCGRPLAAPADSRLANFGFWPSGLAMTDLDAVTRLRSALAAWTAEPV